MAGPPSSESPLGGLSTPEQATEAFELLANETRLAILVTLWERYDPFAESTAVRFSELRSYVGTTDSGQFNYHLKRLDGHFIDATDEGYELSEAGLKLIRSVVAGAGLDDPTVQPSGVDVDCSLCGEPAEILYESGWVEIFCTSCNGLWTETGDARSGHLAKFSLDPAGLANRSPNEIYAAAWVRTFQRLHSMVEGVCPTCSGRVKRALEICDDHETNERCTTCGRKPRVIARLHCTVCKDWIRTTLGGLVKYHPAVVAFCYDRGLELQYGFNDVSAIDDQFERTGSTVEVLSDDPPRVMVTTEVDGDEIGVVLDDALRVVEVGA